MVAILLALLQAPAHLDSLADQLAPILAAEDARRFDADLFRSVLRVPEPLVRRTAVLTVGRLRRREGTPLLIPLLADADTTVRARAAFALGLIADTAATDSLIAFLRAHPEEVTPANLESITALAKIGGPIVGAFFRELISAEGGLSPAAGLRARAALESWRFARLAPIETLLPLTASPDDSLRRAAVYSLGRLGSSAATPAMLVALRDPLPEVRMLAARALKRSTIDSSKVASDAVVSALVETLHDREPGVRTQALRSLASHARPESAQAVLPLLDDPVASVGVEAATALGDLGSKAAAERLGRIAQGRRPFAQQREALVSLARLDSAGFMRAQKDWTRNRDWRRRAAAAVAWERFGGVARDQKPGFLSDVDPRVVIAALGAWASAAGDRPDGPLVSEGRRHLQDPDPFLRSLAADLLAAAPDSQDTEALVAAYRRAQADSIPDAALSALGALRAIAGIAPGLVTARFLSGLQRPLDYRLRSWAEGAWPELSALWGPAFPLEPIRPTAEYRSLARRYLLGTASDQAPHVLLTLDGGRVIELELFGADAPLTVENFLGLVDRGFYDGILWHRVVPNFVVQDGDPRGDGWGGSARAIRDEINPRRYGANTVGMALSGSDTGSSQWFVTLSPQPHLDGGYTVFGRVVAGGEALLTITQGEAIRSIRRVRAH